MEKDHRSLSSEDTQWIVYKLPAFALGAIGPFIVYGVHCILPWWIEVLYIWFDVGMRANFIDNALYDWRFPKFVIWIHRLFWAVLEIYLRVYVDATYRLLVHQWISYYLVGMLQQFLLYLDCDGPTRVEEAAIQLGREASIVYVLVLYVVATVDRLILLLTARWIFFLAVFYLTARTTAKWLGYKLSILSRFWDRVRALTMPSAFRWALYHFSEARINRWFHMFALELSRREQEREGKRREGTPRFQHRPLAKGEIRLLVLQPKPKFLAATIEAHIEHHTLEAAPAYEALSYCWGNSELTDRILIDGKAFPVTASAIDLLVACRRFTRRLRNQHRRVWIDAICIDQSNDVEKSSQIQRMRDIYQRATRVIAYPGGDINPAAARVSVSALYEQANAFAYEDGVSPLSIGEFNDLILSPKWKVVAMLFRSEYFRRAWIIQEIAAGKDVQLLLGGLYISWDTFYKAAQWYMHPKRPLLIPNDRNSFSIMPKRALNNVRALADVRLDFDESGVEVKVAKRRGLEMLLHATQTFSCSDPRDRIFSVLGIASDYDDCDLLRPDYEKSVEKVFEDVARYLILHRVPPTISILSFAGIGFSKARKEAKELPSWVPDWNENRTSVAFCEASAVSRDNYSFRAGIGPMPDIRPAKGAACIVMKGLKCDAISVLSSAGTMDFGVSPGVQVTLVDQTRISLTFAKAAIDLVESLQSMSSKDKINMLQERLWSALVADCIVDTRPPPLEYKATFADWLRNATVVGDSKSMARKLEVILMGARGQGPLAATSVIGDAGIRLHQYESSVVEACIGRGFGITKQGRMCLLPPLTQIGDEVFIPYGARTPFVVRRVQMPKDVGTYELVGEAYVQGIMMGEALISGGLDTVIELQ